jgi:hypothetical protein
MAIKSIPDKAKLVASLIFRDKALCEKVSKTLETQFSEIDFISDVYSFSSFSSYYEEEMGKELDRIFVTFRELISQDLLATIKAKTDLLEHEFMKAGKRTINIDPGILSQKSFILATHKDYTHRIYLRDGVYADLTLMYTKGSFRILPWTYPDYGSPALIELFNSIRERYKMRVSS